MADGYEEKRVAWEENRKREKKKAKKKEMIWYRIREEKVIDSLGSHDSCEMAKKRQNIDHGPHNMNIFTKMPPSFYFLYSETLFFFFHSHSPITHFCEFWAMKTETENKSKKAYQTWDPPYLSDE